MEIQKYKLLNERIYMCAMLKYIYTSHMFGYFGKKFHVVWQVCKNVEYF